MLSRVCKEGPSTSARNVDQGRLSEAVKNNLEVCCRTLMSALGSWNGIKLFSHLMVLGSLHKGGAM